MISIAIIRLLLGRWITDAEGQIKARWQWITATPVHLLLTALALSIAVNLWQWHRVARCAHQLAGIHAAQQITTDMQIQVNRQPALISAQIARQSDAQAPAYYDAVRRAAAAHTIVLQPRTCPVGNTDLPRPDPAAPIDDRPAAAADLVSRPKAEDDQIIAAAGRAAQMHQDALDLIAAGVAVPDTTP